MDERELLIIGGVGGSGTRVFAEAARIAGRSLEGDLNHALDNLWFTFLFKRPGVFEAGRSRDFTKELRTLSAVLDGRAPSGGDLPFLLSRMSECAVKGNNHEGYGRGKWPAGRLAKAMRASKAANVFKEPNASIFLKPLTDYFPNAKYIHVARNGLDMALSDNQQMFHNWAPLFGIDPKRNDTPCARLKFWARLNDEVAEIGEAKGPERLFFARYDDFVQRPGPFAKRLVDFMGGPPVAAPKIAGLARLPKSFERYRDVDPRHFDAEDIEAVRRHGFDVAADFVSAAQTAA